ncbi:MAG TPA: amino acid permease [Micromonosporaceae bacterium]|jgi:APA family basic amino acid/polyamine antiporter|nr:amino acid permease [Micromonosporaceae bacterium]
MSTQDIAAGVPGRRGLGMWLATALVVGNMIGSGIFLLPSALAGYGGISILGWLFTAAGAMLLALVFAQLGRAFPHTGGPYAYSRRAFGDFIGFLTAWGYWIAAWVGNAAIAVAFVSYLGYFKAFDALNDNRVLAAAVAIGAVWLLTFVNVLGVRQGGVMQLVTTVLKFVPLLALALVGVFFISADNFGGFNTSGHSGFGALTAVAALTLWSFIGVESATVPAEDVANPRRTIPRATIIGTAVTALVYILGTVAVMGILPAATLADSGAPFADAADSAFGGWAGPLIAAAAVVSAFGCLNGWILLQGQVPMAAARDNLFPKVFARTTRSGAPVVGLVVSSVLITALAVFNYNASLVDQFTFVILLATLTTLIPYVFSAAAQLLLLITDRARFEVKRLAGHATIAAFALAYAIWTVAGSGYEVVYKGFLLLLLGIPVFLGMKYAAARHGAHLVAAGVAESVAEHGDELRLPADLDAALAEVIAVERKKLGQERE